MEMTEQEWNEWRIRNKVPSLDQIKKESTISERFLIQRVEEIVRGENDGKKSKIQREIADTIMESLREVFEKYLNVDESVDKRIPWEEAMKMRSFIRDVNEVLYKIPHYKYVKET